MLDRIHNLPITGLYDFTERYKLVKRTGDDLERDKLIEAAYLAIRAIEAGHRGKYLELRSTLEEKVSLRPNGSRIFYDRKSRTTRTWDDLILAHTTVEVAANAFLAAEVVEGTFRTVSLFRHRDRLQWRFIAKNAMVFFRCKRVVQCPEFDDGLAQRSLVANPRMRTKCEAALAADEAQEITRALRERGRLQQQWSVPVEKAGVERPDDDPLLNPWITALGSRPTNQSVMRL